MSRKLVPSGSCSFTQNIDRHQKGSADAPYCLLVQLIGMLVYERRLARTTQHEICRPTSASPVGTKIFIKPYMKLDMLTSAQNTVTFASSR